MRKAGMISIALTLIGAVIIVLNLSNVFDASLMMTFFLIWMAVWFIFSLAGVVIISRKGYFPVEKLRGNVVNANSNQVLVTITLSTMVLIPRLIISIPAIYSTIIRLQDLSRFSYVTNV